MSKQSEKPRTKAVLTFLLKVALKEKPLLFVAYFFQLIAEVCMNLLPIVLSKYIMEFLISITQGTPYTEVKEKLIFTVALLILCTFLCNTITNITSALRISFNEWFNRYLEQSISKHAMAMDFEHTEDPDALDQLNKAKEGISWYSGGVE